MVIALLYVVYESFGVNNVILASYIGGYLHVLVFLAGKPFPYYSYRMALYSVASYIAAQSKYNSITKPASR